MSSGVLAVRSEFQLDVITNSDIEERDEIVSLEETLERQHCTSLLLHCINKSGKNKFMRNIRGRVFTNLYTPYNSAHTATLLKSELLLFDESRIHFNTKNKFGFDTFILTFDNILQNKISLVFEKYIKEELFTRLSYTFIDGNISFDITDESFSIYHLHHGKFQPIEKILDKRIDPINEKVSYIELLLDILLSIKYNRITQIKNDSGVVSTSSIL